MTGRNLTLDVLALLAAAEAENVDVTFCASGEILLSQEGEGGGLYDTAEDALRDLAGRGE